MPELRSLGDKTLEDALKFAQEIANIELDRIDRIHQRTLRYIGYVLVAAGGIFAVISWIGYQNLRNMTVSTAKATTEHLVMDNDLVGHEVKKQVSDQLDHSDIVRQEVQREVQQQLNEQAVRDIVNSEIKSYSGKQLVSQVHEELAEGSLHKDIVLAASTEISKTVGQRHLSIAQKKALALAVAAAPELKLVESIPVTYSPSDGEAKTYAEDIVKELSNAGLKTSLQPPYESMFSKLINEPQEKNLVGFEASDKCGPGTAKMLEKVLESISLIADITGQTHGNGGGVPEPCAIRGLSLYIAPRRFE